MKKMVYWVLASLLVFVFNGTSLAQRNIGGQLKTWPKLTEAELTGGTSVKYGVVNSALLNATIQALGGTSNTYSCTTGGTAGCLDAKGGAMVPGLGGSAGW